MAINRLTGKEDVACVIYTHNGLLPSHEKNELLPFAITSIDLEGFMLSEISQTDKDRYHMISIIHVI